MSRGRFITFEGGEGAGKSTQPSLLAEKLAGNGITAVQTREPGGAQQAEILRNLLITGEVDRWSSKAETLLNYAARDDHLCKTIRPALSNGYWVICDRFSDSTRAYQGMAGGVSREMIDAVHNEIVGETEPDLTVILDLPAEFGLKRAIDRGDANRFENKGLEFHEKLRQSFHAIAEEFPKRCVLIDASGSIEEVSRKVWNSVETQLLAV